MFASQISPPLAPSCAAGFEPDAGHLYWLQSYALGGSLQRSPLSLQRIQQQLPPLPSQDPAAAAQQQQRPLCFIVDIGGFPAAALLLQAAPGPAGRPEGELQLLLAAVFPEMEQAASVMAALASYALQQLLAYGTPLSLQQGNVLVLPVLQRVAGRAPGEPPASGSPAAPLLRIAAAPSSMEGWLRHSVQFAPGLSMDALALAVAGHMQDLSDPSQSLAPFPVADNGAYADADPAPDPASVQAVLHAARRLSQAWQEAAPSGAAEESAAAELYGEVAATVAGFMEAAGFPGEL